MTIECQRLQVEADTVELKVGRLEIKQRADGISYDILLDGKPVDPVTAITVSCDAGERVWRATIDVITN